MKKIVLALLCLLTIRGININASTWSYKWFDTTIEIPVGESIYDYEKIPSAKLYKDGIELTDANIEIVTAGDWLYYLANVNTNVVGDYYVWYKAYEYYYMPGTCHDYKCLITFRVVDKEKPKITPITDNIRIARGTKNIDLGSYFNISDNYDKKLDIAFNHNIDTSKVGAYPCSLVVVDDYQNEEKYQFDVEVYSVGSPPKIEMLVDEIKIKKNSKIDLLKYFRVIDDDLDEVKTNIYHTIDPKIPGIYKCEITAKDAYDEVSLKFNVEIYDDNMAPNILQLMDDIKIEYGSEIDLKKYFIITDDYDENIKPIFSHNIDTKKLGVYNCKVVAIDSSGKSSELSFKVEVYGDVKAPTITQIVENIRIKRKSSYDLLNYFSIVDDSGGKINSKFYHLIDINTVGFYDCKLISTDVKGNSSLFSFVVEVYDDVAPTITFLGEGDELNIYLNEEISIKSYFKATDDVDGDITNIINFPAVDKKTPSSFDYRVSVSDYAGNLSEFTIKMNVVDDIVPEIILYNEAITLNYGFKLEEIDYLSYVKSFMDNNQTLDKNLLDVSSNLTTAVGVYSVIYSYCDGVNTNFKELAITVLSTKAPIISAENITINEDEILDLYSQVNVYDESDNKVDSTLVIDDSGVDYSNAGRYEVTAYAINSSGLSSTITFYIIVEEENIFDNDIVKYIAIGLVGLLVVSLGVLYFIKNKNTKIV